MYLEVPYMYKANLIRVIDGDTVVLNVDLGMNVFRKETFRLAGINTPETYGVKKDSEEYKAGLAATQRVNQLLSTYLENDYLIIETMKDSKGKYGRYLARIYFHEGTGTPSPDSKWICLNDLLIDEGLAEVY